MIYMRTCRKVIISSSSMCYGKSPTICHIIIVFLKKKLFKKKQKKNTYNFWYL